MSDLIRLHAPIPVRAAGRVGACTQISLDRMLVAFDGPVDASAVDLLLDGDTVTVEVAVTSARGGLHDLRVLAYAGDGRARLNAQISSLRKTAHLTIAATEDVEAGSTKAGWEGWRLRHCALPELDADAVDLATTFLGKDLAGPLLIAGMTGGSDRAGEVNRRLAVAAQELGIGMGLGSQRAMLEARALSATFDVRREAPDVLLLGNIGAVQLNYGVGIDDVRWLVDAVQADALAIHLNVLQELVQPEGDRDWSGLLLKIEALVAALDVPVLVKETGCGIDAGTARRLEDAGVAALDVGGLGGTSWGWIEGFRAADPQRQAIGATFRDWGTPTAEALVAVREAVDLPLMATGGLRSGLDVAKAIALGADVAGMALPFFRAADRSTEDAVALGRRILDEIRIAAVCSGSARLADLPAALEPVR